MTLLKQDLDGRREVSPKQIALIINLCSKKGRLSKAFEAFDIVTSHKIPPNIVM